MKKKLKMIPILALIMAMALIIPPKSSFTQTIPDGTTQVVTQNPDSVLKTKDSVVIKTSDSSSITVPTTTITAPDEYTIFGVKLPTWANWIVTMALALIVVLPGVQYVLKKIPGADPIDNWLGKVLNVLTFFQDNIVHKEQKE